MKTAIGRRAFRATGVTDYMTSGGPIDPNAKTTSMTGGKYGRENGLKPLTPGTHAKPLNRGSLSCSLRGCSLRLALGLRNLNLDGLGFGFLTLG
jgi:hypothetical protein